MPIYFNAPVRIFGSSDYSSGVIRRRARTQGSGHYEAPMEVSNGFMRKIGPSEYGRGIENGMTILEYSYYSGYYISARQSRAPTCYSQITLDLYTVNAKSDLRERTDAVLVRSCDRNRVEVLSGGGYAPNGERRCDNIYVRVKVPAVIAIQHRRLGFFTPFDHFYFVTRHGVEEIVAARGDDISLLSDISRNIEADWEYI